MWGIDTQAQNTAGARQAPAAAGTPAFFTDQTNPGTQVDADFLNMLQAELLNVVIAGGLEPSKTTYDQVALAIEAIVDEAIDALPAPPTVPIATHGGSTSIVFPSGGNGTVGSQGWRKDTDGLITQWAYIQLEDSAAASPATWHFPIAFAVGPLGFKNMNCAIAAGQISGNARNATCNLASAPTTTSAEFTLFQTNSVGTLATFYVEVTGF